ncbi:MAG: outer membrane protein, partial [Methylocella sp.]
MPASCSYTRALLDALRVGTGLVRATAFCLGVVLTAALSAISVRAADLPSQSPSPLLAKKQIADDWTGFYVGPHIGYGTGHSSWSATQPGGAPNLTGSLDFFQTFDAFTQAGSYFGGLQAGYNYMLPSHALIGVEADVSFPSTLYGGENFSSGILGGANYQDTVEMFGSARGRLGYDLNHWLYYVTGGLAWTYDQVT